MIAPNNFSIAGFSEVVFVVNDIEKSKRFYCDVIGWHVLAEECNNQDLNELWQVEPNAQVDTCLIAAPNSQVGAIRLVKITGVKQSYIRANSQIWDVGGIFDVNTRVKNVHQLARRLHEHQWFGVNDPVEMQFGPFRVYEWLAKSHDGITHALIERIEPPLENDNQNALFSELINASLVIKNHQKELDFFQNLLGFESLIHQEGSFDKATSNVFGMPYELVEKTPHVLTLLSADGSRSGTIELASFPKLTGNDFSSSAKPYNLGITCIRFPIKGIKSFTQHLTKNDVSYHECKSVELAPYGNVHMVAVNSPSGNRIEFFEVAVN